MAEPLRSEARRASGELTGSEADAPTGGRLGWPGEWDQMLFAAAVLWGTVYYAYYFFFQARWPNILLPDSLSDVPVLLAAALLLLRAAACATDTTKVRLAWQALAAAYVCYATGDVLEQPFPSWADLAYGGYYPLCFIGMALFHEGTASRLKRLKLGLDYLMILVGSSAILWYFLLRPIAAGRGALEATLATAYPACDFVLVFAAMAPLAGRVRTPRDGHLLLVLAYLLQFGVDTSYALRQLTDSSSSIHWTNCLWTVSAVCVMAAALRQRRTDRALGEEASRTAFGSERIFALLPYIAIACVAGLLLYASREHWGDPLGGAVFAALAVTGLVVARQLLASRENTRLLTERAAVLSQAATVAEAANRTKSQFLANMSHEIRTPLNGVLGMAELLMESGLTSSQRRLAELARSSGESLLSIIDDILDFSRIEAGRLELEQVSFELRETVAGVVELLAERARAKDVELRALVAADVPNVVRGDPGRLRQVLVNLVGNAVKFTPQGEIVVQVGLLDKDGPRSRLAFEVRDTGIGIVPEAHSRIFDAFAQADGSTTRRYGGTGLGLAICKQLVDLMGGAIEVESALGVGTTFRFTACFGRQAAAADDALAESPRLLVLRRALGREAEREAGSVRSQGRSAERFEGRVLLVEDCAVNLAVAEGMLELLGPRVELASDGAEALTALSRETFDLVLMDCMMPGMDGCAATQELRRREGGSGRHTPVVALTANAMSGDRERCLAAGMDDYLSKPFRHEELRQVLARWLPARKAEALQSRLPA